jgi:UDP-N-acetylglucosamine 2-epimerase (non-hydrolysing)
MGAWAKKTVVCAIGTRPEAIKMAPVIKALDATSWARCRVLLTGQHRELVEQALAFFEIEPHDNLDAMRLNLAPAGLARYLTTAISEVLEGDCPDLVMAQGDTTSVAAAAMACFVRGVPFAHVEAGLRTHRLFAPFPEEANRVVASHLAAIHFAPTVSARENLEREGIHPARIVVTGNTVIDALVAAARRDLPIGVRLDPRKRLVLVTVHRRESFGEPLWLFCRAIQELEEELPDVEFLWPVHPNPMVGEAIGSLVSRHRRIHLCAPLAYGSFVSALKRATVILSDSGGIQEEAPALGKPVLVLRNETERHEALSAGVAKLVGLDPHHIVAETIRLLRDPVAYRSMAKGASPYGDGRAADRIVSAVGAYLDVTEPLRAAG